MREPRRRSAIEPIIGHLKAEGHLRRCFLKGRPGHAANFVLSAVGHNFRRILARLRHFWRDRTHRCDQRRPQISFLTNDYLAPLIDGRRNCQLPMAAGLWSGNLLNVAAFRNLKCVIAMASSLRRRCPFEISMPIKF
jgi:hypothetical protein